MSEYSTYNSKYGMTQQINFDKQNQTRRNQMATTTHVKQSEKCNIKTPRQHTMAA